MERNSAINLFSIDVFQPNEERLTKIITNTINPNAQVKHNSNHELEGNRIRNSLRSLPPNMNNDGSIPTTNPPNSPKALKTAKAGRAKLRLIHITRIGYIFRTPCKKPDKVTHASRNDTQAQPPTSPRINKLPKDNRNKTRKTPIRTDQNMRLTPRRCPSTISLGERPVVSNNSKTPERRSSPIRRQSTRQKRKGLEGKNPNPMHSRPRHFPNQLHQKIMPIQSKAPRRKVWR